MNGAKSNAGGFTLVEVLIVICIIGILASLLVVQLGTARAKARDVKRVSDINQIQVAVHIFYDDNGYYPSDISDASLGKYMAAGRVPLDPLSYSDELTPELIVRRILGIPGTVAAGNYYYACDPIARPSRFHLYVELEKKNGALDYDGDINSKHWAAGDTFDASKQPAEPSGQPVKSENCDDYSFGSSKQCIYDVGLGQ